MMIGTFEASITPALAADVPKRENESAASAHKEQIRNLVEIISGSHPKLFANPTTDAALYRIFWPMPIMGGVFSDYKHFFKN